MTSATWQFAAALVLVAAWVTALASPTLANWFRRPRSRAEQEREPMDGSGSFLAEFRHHRPRPLAAWRDQPLDARRLQMMLALAFACLFSLFLAIAFEGEFVRLFVVMLVLFALQLVVAVVVGSGRLRRMEAEGIGQADLNPGRRSARGRRVGTRSGDIRLDFIDADDLGLARRLDRSPVTDPVPGPLVFEPLDFDKIFDEAGVGRAFDDLLDGLDDPDGDDVLDGTAGSDVLDGPGEEEAEDGAGFAAAPGAGAKQASARARQSKRRRARPIYIESTLDEVDDRQAGTDGR